MEKEKKVLEILDFEDKTTNAGKEYTRFKTSEGWMSCFNNKTIPAIKKLVGKIVSVEVKKAGSFQNIEKLVEEVKNGTEKVEEVKVKTNNKEMYVSYAKDVFCAVITRISQAKFDEMTTEDILSLVDLSIKAVKKIEKEF